MELKIGEMVSWSLLGVETEPRLRHWLGLADLEAGAGQEFLAVAGRTAGVDIVYVDPPWGPALASGFRTKAGGKLMRKVDYTKFLDCFLEVIAAAAPKVVFCEMGRQWTELLCERAALIIPHLHQHHQQVLPIFYGSNRPADLVIWGDVSGFDLNELNYTNDLFTPSLVFAQVAAGACVFDPCTGLGTTAKAALMHGHQFLGLDLVGYRINRVVSVFEQAGWQPQLPTTQLSTMEAFV